MTDEFEDYMFEKNREISNDFALANGDVTSVLKGVRRSTPANMSLRKRSFFRSSGPAKHIQAGNKDLPVSRPRGRSAGLSVDGRKSVFSVSGISLRSGNPTAVRDIGSLSVAGRNTSNGEDLTLKAQQTPMFSGLFAKHDADGLRESGKGVNAVSGLADRFTASSDTRAKSILQAGTGGVLPDGVPYGSAGGASAGTAASKSPVRRNLSLSAEDMAKYRSYQVGYDIEVRDSGSAHSVAYNGSGKASSVYLSQDGGEYYISVPGTGYKPVRPVSGEIIIDDPEMPIGGWIGIPEHPIGGWIGIPEWPIGGWIIVDPLPEYDVFEEYGIDLSSDWTEYTDTDFSRIDLAYGSKLSFSVSATNAATFTIYQCVQDGNGGYELKALQTTALVFDRESGNYAASTQAILLEAGEYCLCVQSSAPAQEEDPAPSYKFELDHENSDMFVEGDNSDDWTDLKTEGEFGEVAYAGILDEDNSCLLSDWVGFGDAVDYAGFTLDSAARLSFSIDSTDAAKFTIYKLVQSKDGTYSLKTLQMTALTYDREFENYEATTKALLLEAGDYYISMQSTNAAQGGSAYYDIYLNEEDGASVFFTSGDNSDDWTDIRTEGSLGSVRDIGVVDESRFELCSDWVGYGDEFDYAKFSLNSAAKLSFSIDADGAAKFTIYKLVQDKSGNYSLKALQSTSLSYDREFEYYDATTKALLLEAGDYYFSMQAADAAQGGSAHYSICLNEDEDGSDFFLDGNNSDDWTDLATEGADGSVDDIGILNDSCFDLRGDWVGFGDAVDYVRFTLETAAKLSFSVMADDTVKFSIHQLVRDKNGTCSLKTLQTTALSYSRENEWYETVTKGLLLEAGEYYFSVQSTNAAQGGSAWYNVYLNQDENGSVFSPEDGDSDDWSDLRTEGAYGSVGSIGQVNESSFDLLGGWVGFGDAVDYAGFTLDTAANLSFSVNADGAAKFTIYELVQDRNGAYSLKALQSTALAYDREYEDYEATTKSLFLAKGEYYISVQSTDAAQGGGAWYSVCLNGEDSRFFTADNSGCNWSDLEILGPDGSVGDLGVVDESSTELTSGWVGGRESDFARITLFDAAKLSFSVSADGAAKFSVYRLVQDKNGKYSLDALQTTSLSVNRQTGEYDAATKALLLEAGEYYISMQSADPSRVVNYQVGLNGDGSTFFTEGNNWDDWTDVSTAGIFGGVGFAGVIDGSCTELLSDWVGFGDAVDYAGFSLYDAASVRFTLRAEDAVTFTIYTLSQTKSGKYSLTPLQTTALTLNKATGEYEAVTKALLLEAGEYYFSVQSANAAQGGSAHYSVNVNPSDCTFYTQCNNCDDWTDLRTEGASGSVGYVGVIDGSCTEVLSDWVGFGDAVDYMGFTLFDAAKLSFSVSADGAAAFTVYQLVQDRKGAYSLKALQTTALTMNRATGEYEAVTKGFLLEAGEYYFSVQSTNAAQGGGANYRVDLNGDGSSFYTECDNYDDWTNLATDGASGDVGDIGIVDGYCNELVSGWVGFGDAVDYMKFTLNSAAKLSFSPDASDAAAFTVYRLIQSSNGSCSLKALQTTTLAFNKQMQDYESVTKALLLEAGDYYISVQSTNAAQGGSASYNVNLNSDVCVFYADGDNSDDWTDVRSQGAFGAVGSVGVVDEYRYELASGWVGFGDEFDYASFTLFDKANLSFTLDATDAATFTIYSLTEARNGTYKLKTLQTTALVFDKQSGKYTANTKSLLLEAGDYYFSLQSTNAAQGGSAYYNLSLNETGSEFFPNETAGDENWGAVEPEPAPMCGGDTGTPVELLWTCAYPACDESTAAVPVQDPVCEALPGADSFASADGGSAGLAVSELSENKPVDALKDLSSLA